MRRLEIQRRAGKRDRSSVAAYGRHLPNTSDGICLPTCSHAGNKEAGTECLRFAQSALRSGTLKNLCDALAQRDRVPGQGAQEFFDYDETGAKCHSRIEEWLQPYLSDVKRTELDEIMQAKHSGADS